jgi:hypothetical protein
MIDRNWKEFIEKAKTEYYKVRNVSCPAFGNQLIHFNKHGFNHLLRKGRVPRSRYEQIQRIDLLPSAVHILKITKEIRGYRSNRIGNVTADFWTIRGVHNKKNIRVILRKVGKGVLHFFSVMQE